MNLSRKEDRVTIIKKKKFCFHTRFHLERFSCFSLSEYWPNSLFYQGHVLFKARKWKFGKKYISWVEMALCGAHASHLSFFLHQTQTVWKHEMTMLKDYQNIFHYLVLPGINFTLAPWDLMWALLQIAIKNVQNNESLIK